MEFTYQLRSMVAIRLLAAIDVPIVERRYSSKTNSGSLVGPWQCFRQVMLPMLSAHCTCFCTLVAPLASHIGIQDLSFTLDSCRNNPVRTAYWVCMILGLFVFHTCSSFPKEQEY